jgi:hypothetical protein
MFYVSRFSRRKLLLFGAAVLPGQAWARSTWLGSALRQMGGDGTDERRRWFSGMST